MGAYIGIETIVAYAVALLLMYALGWLSFVPLKYLWKLILNGVLGGLLLVGINLVGGLFGATIAINPITALISGFMGIPGVILLFLLQILL